jgi:3-isopropylmalate/(R)-2-methylmalate dehydratase large subunit
MFTGAITAIINPDKKSLDYIEDRKRKNLDALSSDPDANYAARYTVDVTNLEPLVVVPPSPANTSDLAEFIGTEVHVGYLGSCASGRVEDLALAADVLEGHKIKEGFQLHVVPTSQEIMEKASESGIISRLIKAGAFLSSSSCDYCFGRMGVMRAGQRAVSTGTLNVRGRMGSPDSEIFIVNAAAVAAAAIEGRIADPRPYLRK